LSGRRPRTRGRHGLGRVGSRADRSSVLGDRDELRRHLDGDRAAFAAIVDRHQGGLLRYAAHRLGVTASGAVDASACEDVVQETFLRLLREAPTLNGTTLVDESLSAWLFRVCRNLCADAARKEVRMQQRHLRVAVPDLEPERPFALEMQSLEEQGKVRTLLHDLPDHEREVLTLKVVEGRSYREIQALLGTTLHDVFTTAHRALRRLADGLRAAGLA
jgi:RNA polymerase sigma-70 factor (ECF subfamily)